jgi:plasmid stabilization system protein ParE
MGKINWSITALKNLEDVAEFIALDSLFYALDFTEKILSQVSTLKGFPRRGRVVPEFKKNNIRELIYQNYRIVYKIKRADLYIVSITHGTMDILKKAKKESWEIG